MNAATAYLPRSISMKDKLDALSVPVPECGCFLWLASVETSGYGHGSFRGVKFRAHRAAWVETNGPIPEGMAVLHKCDTRPCINPEHLFLGTSDDNIADRVRKGRSGGGSLPGEAHPNAKLTPDAVALIRAMRADGATHEKIAEEIGVGRRCVGRVLDGTSWSHIHPEEQ